MQPLGCHVVALLLGFGGGFVIYVSGMPVTHAAISVLVGIAASAFVRVLLRLVNKPLIFDKGLGRFWEGRAEPDQIVGGSAVRCRGSIADIHALQLVGTYRWVGVDTEHKEPRNTYELNLVMKDATRLSIVCHDDFTCLRKDAHTLATFLRKPLWERG